MINCNSKIKNKNSGCCTINQVVVQQSVCCAPIHVVMSNLSRIFSLSLAWHFTNDDGDMGCCFVALADLVGSEPLQNFRIILNIFIYFFDLYD